MAQGVPHPWDLVLLEPPVGPNKTQLFSPLKPTQSIGNLDEDWVCRAGCSTLQKVSLEALWPRDGSWEPPTQGAGRLQSGVNRDEGWQGEKPCVFSQGGVFSPLSGAQAMQAVCVLTVSAWDISHIPCCSASQGNPRKGSGCSSTTQEL